MFIKCKDSFDAAHTSIIVPESEKLPGSFKNHAESGWPCNIIYFQMNASAFALFSLAAIVTTGMASASTTVEYHHRLHTFDMKNRARRSPRGRDHGHGHGGYRRPRYGKGTGFVQQISDGLEQAVNQAKLFTFFFTLYFGESEGQCEF